MGTNFNNPMKKGKNFTFETELEVDFDTFERGEDYNYELTLDDLKNKNLKAEFHCSDCDAATEDAFDFDKAEIMLIVNVGSKEYKIDNVVFD